ncbi:OmpA family protein [Alteromonadaceae bacterium BrNp21-10]|nr:OmpA family protein [Alteromonadaceae bacterium BrNp21-10]
MKKNIIYLSIALTMSSPVIAEITEIQPSWLGVFTEYYRADEDKFTGNSEAVDGVSFGFEGGVGLSPKWAGRIEWADLNLQEHAFTADGYRVGMDALYFPNATSQYFFAGLKAQKLQQTYNLLNIGVGNRWTLKDNWNIYAEAAANREFSDGHQDISLKLGLAYLFGSKTSSYTPKDDDNDGVVNTLDQCPNTPAGEAVDKKGCSLPTDNDNDGVLNNVDQCPNTPASTTVDSLGCAIKLAAIGDTDHDGVNDDIDQCADTPINDKVDDVGCSLFAEKKIPIALNVLFANNSSNIDNPQDQSIIDFAEALKTYPEIIVTIEGHSSAPGDADYNQTISEQRANAVRDLLISQYHIPASQLLAQGFGETRLLDDRHTEAAHIKNRRIAASATAISRTKVQK